jgi:hypothetical protein
MNQQVIQQIQTTVKGFKNVRQEGLLYDVIRIGSEVESNVPGWYNSLSDLADADVPLSFFDQRQTSETSEVYTNMRKKTGIDTPWIFTSFGIGIVYPDPINADMFDGDRAAGKVLTQGVVNHSIANVFLGGADDKFLTGRIEHFPYGFGVTGNQMGSISSYASLLTNGDALGGNRFKFPNMPMILPKDISLSVRIDVSKTLKKILRALDTVKPIVCANGTIANEVLLISAFRGMRDIQQAGNYLR